MSFLTELGNQLQSQISSQFLGGELSDYDRTLNSVEDGKKLPYGKLGDFAGVIDKTAQRSYTEEGYLNIDKWTTLPKNYQIYMQQPDATLLIKKKMFSSLSNNFSTVYSGIEDKIFMETVKVLMQNKCNQISAYEKLCKIESAVLANGQIDEQLLPLVVGLADTAGFFNENISNMAFPKAVNRIRAAQSYSKPNFYTSWIPDYLNYRSNISGTGTGVIELSNFTSLNTTTTISQSSGSFNAELSDPYNLMNVTENDINVALNKVLGTFAKNNSDFALNLGKEDLDALISKKISDLNNLRAARGASPIYFKVNPDTVFGRRIIAIVSSLGQEIPFKVSIPGIKQAEIDESYYAGDDPSKYIFLNEGLSDQTPKQKRYTVYRGEYPKAFQSGGLFDLTEVGLFSDVVNNIYNKIAIQKNSSRDYLSSNGDPSVDNIVNAVKSKLIFYFENKCIIQPMDQVHVFITSRTKMDDKVLSGLQSAFNGLGLFQKLTSTAQDLSQSIVNLIDPNSSLDLEMEKQAFFNSEISNRWWLLIRNQFINNREGTHVFAGVINSVDTSYSSGRYSVSIRAEDNKFFLKQGRVNFNPALDTFNGTINDPLTPYKTTFGTVYSLKSDRLELLPENKKLLSSDAKLIKFTDGPKAGKYADEKSLWQGTYTDTSGTKKVLAFPDGLVHKWKEGIGVLTFKGDSTSIFNDIQAGHPSQASSVFANQDVMNIISVLVTGQPYNFQTYLNAAAKSVGIIDQGTQGLSSSSPLNILTSDIARNNTLWGNFIPFKNLNLDEESYINILTGQTNAINQINQIQTKLKDYQKIKLNAIFKASQGNYDLNAANANIKDKLQKLQTSIVEKYEEIKATQTKGPITMNIVGNDVSFDYDQSINSGDVNLSISDPSYRRYIRRKLNFLTRRQTWLTRANQDKNFFIVEDNYDKNYDLVVQEYANRNSEMSMFNNEYLDVLEKINSYLSIIDFEFFCDSQGHLRARSPQYNRIPSSVFYKMIQNSKIRGEQIFPKYITEMYYKQFDSLANIVTSIEDQIRLMCLFAGVGNTLEPDGDIKALGYLISGIASGGSSPSTTSPSGRPFKFVSDPKTGEISDYNKIINLFPGSNLGSDVAPDINAKKNDFIVLKNFNSTLSSQLNIENTFDPLVQVSSVANIAENVTLKGFSTIKNSDIVADLINRIQNKTGQTYNPSDFVLKSSNDGAVQFTIESSVDSYKITKTISDLLSKRQTAVKNLFNLVKSSVEIMSIDLDDSISGSLLFPMAMGNKKIPEAFESLIEDESYDDYGPGSGKRYVIKNSQIIRYSFRENIPEHMMVTVSGKFSPSIPQQSANGSGVLPQQLNYFPGGANAETSAVAVDYDLWKMYGYRPGTSRFIPFFNDPDSQCAPYAVAMLSKARKKIFSAEVTIIGNEYMQPGEVVYLENKNMLFYVESVSHGFNQGQSFTTRLTLSYGHKPGEYIPTTLDLAGRMLFNNKDTMGVVGYRQGSNSNSTPAGAFTIDPTVKIDKAQAQDFTYYIGYGSNSGLARNIKTKIKQMMLSNNAASSSDPKQMILELRQYYDSKIGGPFALNPVLTSFAEQIKDVFTTLRSEDEDIVKDNGDGIPSYLIKIITVDLQDRTEPRAPSGEALGKAKEMFAKYGSGNLPGNVLSGAGYTAALKKYVCNNIIDCVITSRRV